MQNTRTFNIQFVSNITGINPHTIRAWEKRYEAVHPVRDQNGRRLYSQVDIDRLNLLHDLVKIGNSISDIAGMPSSELNEIHTQFVTPEKSKEEVDPNFDTHFSLQNIYMGLNFYKLDVIGHELKKSAEGLNSEDFALKMVEPMLTKVRKLIQDNVMSVENALPIFHLLKSELMKKLFCASKSTPKSKTILIAAARGELNEIGSLLSAIICQARGLEVRYIGANVEAQPVSEVAEQLGIKLIFVGLNYSTKNQLALTDQSKYLETIGNRVSERSHILVGAFEQSFKLPYSNMSCYDTFIKLNEKLMNI